jgi:uncharacterized protein YndB with AHSA1/START domain
MAGDGKDKRAPAKNRLVLERTSDRELVATRTIDGPARLVWEAWTKAEYFQQWWVPKSLGMKLLSCALDVRPGGAYRLVFSHPEAPEPMAFHGTYLEVVPNSKLVWTNDEAGGAGPISTVTFEERAGQTLLVMHDLYPSKEALDEAMATQSISWNEETFDQLDDRLAGLAQA